MIDFCLFVNAAICEMIALKQEYGEVVVAVGSALNPQNTSAFTQADCALALSPLLPQACVRLPAVDYPSVPVVQPEDTACSCVSTFVVTRLSL